MSAVIGENGINRRSDDGFLVKPFAFEELKAKVEDMLGPSSK
jgi:hypothetical protein